MYVTCSWLWWVLTLLCACVWHTLSSKLPYHALYGSANTLPWWRMRLCIQSQSLYVSAHLCDNCHMSRCQRMKGVCLDVPKALETVISCEALYQECGTLRKRPSFGHLQQLHQQSFDAVRSAMWAFRRYMECITQSTLYKQGYCSKSDWKVAGVSKGEMDRGSLMTI